MRRSIPVLATLLAVLGCDGGSGDGPSGPGAPGGPERGARWTDPWTLGFVDPQERVEAPDAVFVRLVRASIGGDLDALAEEEVRISFESRGRRIQVGRRSIDLPSSSTIEVVFEGAPFVEVHPEEPILLVVRAEDVDLTGSEEIACLDLRLTAADFPTAEAERTFAVAGALEGTSFTLSLARAPRREPDAAAREAVGRMFGALAADRDLASPAARIALANDLERAAGEALHGSAASLDTGLRGLLTGLARAAGLLAATARSSAAVDPERVRRAQAAIREELARTTARGDAVQAAREAAEPDLPDAASPGAYEELGLRAARAKALLDDPSFGRTTFRLRQAVGALEEVVARARAGLAELARVEPEWRRFRDRVEDAIGRE